MRAFSAIFLSALVSLPSFATETIPSGEIKRIRVRESGDGSSFRAITVTESNVSPVGVVLTVQAEVVDTGKSAKATASLAGLRVADSVSWTDTVGGLESAVVEFTVGTDSYTADVAVDEWTEVDLTSGTLARLRIEPVKGGYTLHAEHVGSKSGGVASVSKAGAFAVAIDTGAAEIAGKLFDGAGETWRGRWAAKFSTDLLAGDTGALIELSAASDRTRPELIFAEWDDVAYLGVPTETAIVDAALGEVNAKGMQQLSILTADPRDGTETTFSEADATGDVVVEIVNEDTDAEVATATLTQPVETYRVLGIEGIEGDEGDTAYITLTAKGKGFAVEIPITVELVEGRPRIFGQNVSAKIKEMGNKVQQIGSGWNLTVILTGEDAPLITSAAASVSVACNPDLEDCESVPVDAVEYGAGYRWVLPFSAAKDAKTYAVSAEIVEADGTVVDGTEFAMAAGPTPPSFGTRYAFFDIFPY